LELVRLTVYTSRIQADRLALLHLNISSCNVHVVESDLQCSEAENDTNRDLCITIELNIPEKGYWQQSAEPVRGNVDSCRSIVNVRKCLCWIAFSSWS
jgi:hypothetical protein